MARKTYGKTPSGTSITDELIEKLAAKAEGGYDVDEMLRRRGGRPSNPFASNPSYAKLSSRAPSTTTKRHLQ
jgi:hypothetical protein